MIHLLVKIACRDGTRYLFLATTPHRPRGSAARSREVLVAGCAAAVYGALRRAGTLPAWGVANYGWSAQIGATTMQYAVFSSSGQWGRGELDPKMPLTGKFHQSSPKMMN